MIQLSINKLIQPTSLAPEKPEGDSHQDKSDGDTCRLALGCKLQILVSLRVFRMESHYIYPFRYHLILCIKKFTKNA